MRLSGSALEVVGVSFCKGMERYMISTAVQAHPDIQSPRTYTCWLAAVTLRLIMQATYGLLMECFHCVIGLLKLYGHTVVATEWHIQIDLDLLVGSM